MRVSYVCLDPGVPVFGAKGASVHVQEVVRALRRAGHEVVLHAARCGDLVPADLADLTVVETPVRADDPAGRERAQAEASRRAARDVLERGRAVRRRLGAHLGRLQKHQRAVADLAADHHGPRELLPARSARHEVLRDPPVAQDAREGYPRRHDDVFAMPLHDKGEIRD